VGGAGRGEVRPTMSQPSADIRVIKLFTAKNSQRLEKTRERNSPKIRGSFPNAHSTGEVAKNLLRKEQKEKTDQKIHSQKIRRETAGSRDMLPSTTEPVTLPTGKSFHFSGQRERARRGMTPRTGRGVMQKRPGELDSYEEKRPNKKPVRRAGGKRGLLRKNKKKNKTKSRTEFSKRPGKTSASGTGQASQKKSVKWTSPP